MDIQPFSNRKYILQMVGFAIAMLPPPPLCGSTEGGLTVLGRRELEYLRHISDLDGPLSPLA